MLATEVHDEPGVVPGRYPGGPIPLHVGPTPQQQARAAERTAADALAGRLCAAATQTARSEATLVELVGEFDATGAVRCWTDMKSVAHWLGWACSMTPGVAREHVRVARALRRMPTVAQAFRDGRLSYSKVREVTRVVDLVDDEGLCGLALTATASQLARTVSAFRAFAGTRIRQQDRRRVVWHTGEDGMVTFSARLPADEAATVIAAINAARDQFGTPPPTAHSAADATDQPGIPAEPAAEGRPTYGNADALLDVARGFLATQPEDRSGEDRTLVVVQVTAQLLADASTEEPTDDPEDVPAGTPSGTVSVGDVPAGTSAEPGPSRPVCHVQGVGPVEPQTAQRLACDGPVLGAVVDAYGDVLALGRTRRLVSRAQRRALMIRDQGMCQFPGCHQSRHLEAHHRVAWAAGGLTELDNLVLLCRWHHTCVHEGGMHIVRVEAPRHLAMRWEFRMPDGTAHRSWYSDEQLPGLLAAALDHRDPRERALLASITGFDHPEARTIRPRWAGERFDLAACVDALFTLSTTTSEPAQEARAA